MSDSTIFGDIELRNEEITRPPVLTADFEATADTGTTRTSLASFFFWKGIQQGRPCCAALLLKRELNSCTGPREAIKREKRKNTMTGSSSSFEGWDGCPDLIYTFDSLCKEGNCPSRIEKLGLIFWRSFHFFASRFPVLRLRIFPWRNPNGNLALLFGWCQRSEDYGLSESQCNSNTQSWRGIERLGDRIVFSVQVA
jgi:hypothetical protein